jgi:hypothetical protein
MAHSWRIRSRTRAFAAVRIVALTSRSRSSLFAAIRLGQCKQGVEGSSLIVSTLCDQGLCGKLTTCL